MGDESLSMTTAATKKKKKNVFKSIAKGISFKKKKKHPDDASVLGVSVATNSVPGPPPQPLPAVVNGERSNNDKIIAPSKNDNRPIQVILLLMDPASRRFELLQLEFDSAKALVSDILLQIEPSATEKTLREMVYVGVCDRGGMEMISSMKLSQFCNAERGTELVLAIPTGMSGKETAALATPILEDEKVVEMLRPCGVQLTSKPKTGMRNVNKLSKIDEEEKSSPTSTSNRRSLTKEARATNPKYSNLPTAALGMLVLAILVFAVKRHRAITRPIQSGQCLLPGQWKGQCGIWELFPGKFFCGLSSLSKLSVEKDGTVRYFSNVRDNSDEIEEIWSAGGSGRAECIAGGDSKQCVDNLNCNGALFTKEGEKWFVEVNGGRTLLINDVVQKFT